MNVPRLLRLMSIVFIVSISSLGLAQTPQPADVIITNGKFITVDPAKPAAECVAIKGDILIAVGTNAEILRLKGLATQVLDLKGALAVPGLIEGHGHFMGLGNAKLNLDLMQIKNWDEAIEMVKEAAAKAKPGEWILGRGWHQEKWNKTPMPNVEGFPTYKAMSKVSPDNPVYLTHASGHASFANAKAMQLAGITKATKSPEGGEILKDVRGNPIGIFRETASELIGHALGLSRSMRTKTESDAYDRKIVQAAVQECLSKGITSFYDAGVSYSTVDFYKKLVDEKQLGIRLWVMLGENNAQLAKKMDDYRIINYGDKRLTVRAIKRLIDGALGSRGAWLLEPYADLSTSTGLNTDPVEEMKETARLAITHGFQLCTHAIGDRGNRETLNIYEDAFKANPDKTNLRWRIEHAQHINATDIPRFGKLGVIAAMQGIHCTSDAPYVLARLGSQRAEEGAYVWQKLMKSGAIICNGTDTPVEAEDPIACFYASVSRKLKDGSVFYGSQRMTREEALKSYTINAAYTGFDENIKGSLTPGKLADITVLSKDIMTIPEDEIPTTKVLYTIVGGKVMFRNK
ncbi:MAG: amidohydrolase family protein [bacterium]